MTVSLTGRSQDCLAARRQLFHCEAPEGLSRTSRCVLTFFFFSFIAEEMRSVGKQNSETCCLWVKLVNANYVA